jgi:O-antigen ligase
MAARLDPVDWIRLSTILALSALVGLLAGIDPRLALAAAVAVGFVLIVFADLAAGLAVFGFFSFLELIPFGTSLVSVGKLGGAVLALAWLAVIATRPQARNNFLLVYPGMAWVLVLFVGWCAISMLWAEDPFAALGSAGRYALNAILFMIVFTAIREKRQAVLVAGAFLAGTCAAAIYGLVTPPADPELAAAGRLGGTNLDPNELASVLVAGIALSLGVAANLKRSPGLWLAAWAAAAFCLVSIFLTFSRGGLFALGIMLIAAILLAGRWRIRIALGAVVVAAAAAYYIAALAPTAERERIAETTTGQARIFEGRTTIWQIGWRMVEAKPAQGVGGGNFREASGHYLLEPGTLRRTDEIINEPQTAHNTYLEILSELGIVGLALFAVIVVFSLASCLRAARIWAADGDTGGEALARAAAVALVGTLAADFFLSQEFNKQLWLLLGFGPTLLALARHAGMPPGRRRASSNIAASR